MSPNRISSISSYEKEQVPLTSFVRRDISLVNVARETEKFDNDWQFDIDTLRVNINSSQHNEADEKYFYDDPDEDENNDSTNYDPVCRVVATSDGKIPPSAYASLSHSSKSIVEKLELLFSAQSQKKLRDLTYLDSVRERFTDNESQNQLLLSTLKQSLEDGGYRLMDRRDFDLCSALNAGYLLRLSLLPDLKDFDPTLGQEFYPELFNDYDVVGSKEKDKSLNNKLLFDGRVLIFRRGYSEELTTGRLLLPKLDFFQASLVQRSSASLTRKLGALEQKSEDAISAVFNKLQSTARRWLLQVLNVIQGILLDLVKNSGLLDNKLVSKLVANNEFLSFDFSESEAIENTVDSTTEQSARSTEFRIRGNRIFKLARYGVGEGYSAFNLIANSLDISNALDPFSLCEIGNDDAASVEVDMYEGIDSGKLVCQYDEIYGSASNGTTTVRLLERVSIANTVDFFSKNGRRDLVKNFFKESTLKEPAYEEVVVIWRPLTKPIEKKLSRFATPPEWIYDAAKVFDMERRLPMRYKNDQQEDVLEDTAPPLEIRCFGDVPMANIQAVLPKTKLVFRPADAFVFDAVSLISFVALGASLKFDNPRLDLIALVSLSLFALRTFFRYSNKYARYDLLVNKFLTKKLTHRGAGALEHIVSQSNLQRALKLGLARDWLHENELLTGSDRVKLLTNVDRIDVDVQSAVNDLDSLGLLDDRSSQEPIQKMWNDILFQ